MNGSSDDPQDPNGVPPGQGYGSGPPPGQPYSYGPPPGVPYGTGPGPTRMGPSEERNWALAAHLSAIVIQFFGPLLIMLLQGQKSPFVRAHAVEALNFNISITIYFVASLLLMLAIVGVVLVPMVLIFWFVATILAAIAASKGRPYRYPLTIRLVL